MKLGQCSWITMVNIVKPLCSHDLLLIMNINRCENMLPCFPQHMCDCGARGCQNCSVPRTMETYTSSLCGVQWKTNLCTCTTTLYMLCQFHCKTEFTRQNFRFQRQFRKCNWKILFETTSTVLYMIS